MASTLVPVARQSRPVRPLLVTGCFRLRGPHLVTLSSTSMVRNSMMPACRCSVNLARMQSVAELVNQSHVRCASPRMRGLGWWTWPFLSTIRPLFDAADFPVRSVAHLIRLSPSTGPQFGGTALTAVGTSFQNSGHSACRFTAASGTESELSPSARWLSHSLLECMLPALPIGRYSVQVSSNRVDFNPDDLTFVVAALPAVTSVSPSAGSCQGNTLVRVAGFHLSSTGSATCKFGSKLTPATIDASSEILCVSPPYGAGQVAIEVSSNGQDFSSSNVTFVYSASAFILV